jgi:YHS domain-containing protein
MSFVLIIYYSQKGKFMYRLTLGLLTFAFIFSFNITWSQVKTDSSLVKNPVTTKSIDKTKVTTTKTIDKTKVGVTKTTTSKETEVTKSINEKKIDVTKPINEKKIDVTKPIPLVTKGTGKPINTLCIVSGEKIDSKVTADYKGVTYAFCCKTCLKKFTANPEKYVAKLDKETSKSKN